MPKVYLRYSLIGQQPSDAQAFQPEYNAEFRAGGRCFSASTVNIPIQYDLTPMEWVYVGVHMTARTPECAVRIRRYEYVVDPTTQEQVAQSVYLPALVSPVINAPRTVTYNCTAEWHLPPQGIGGIHYVLETRGMPIIYSAFLHGVTQDGSVMTPAPAPAPSPDLSAFVAQCQAAAAALAAIQLPQ